MVDSTSYRHRWALALFSMTTALLFADQNLMAPSLTAIAKEFDMNDEDRDRKLGGDISLAFFLLGVPASLIVGLLADTHDRSKVFGWTVFIGETACFLTYFVRTYNQLYICRAVNGFSIGGALPVIYSIVGDLFSAEDRHIVSAIVSFGMGAGISVGQAVAGYIGPIFGWRLPFIIISVPALFCAALVYFTVEDPERGAMEHISEKNMAETGENEDGIALVPIKSHRNDNDNKTHINESNNHCDHIDDNVYMKDEGTVKLFQENNRSISYWKNQLEAIISLLMTPTVALSLLQGAPGCVPWGIINVFLNDYLSEDRGFSVQAATTILVCFSVGYSLGLVVGGAGGRFLYKIDIRFPALLAGGTAIMGCFPLWYLINFVDSTTPYYISISSAIVAGLGSAPTGPIIKATLTNVTLPNTRGKAFALFTILNDLGNGLGPYFVSLLGVKFGGRLPAFNIGVFGWILCGFTNLAIFFTVVRDERMVQTTLAGVAQVNVV